MIKAEPFLKWAGGKRQLIGDIESLFPSETKLSKTLDIYIEPFVGGGALLFHVLSNYKVNKVIINDINSDLMLSYKVIKDHPYELIEKLKLIEEDYLKLNDKSRERYYYKNLRQRYNSLSLESINSFDFFISKAALLLAINKTCFNGLYRQNNKGEFNVPFGRYKNPSILNIDNIINASKVLRRVEILNTSYDKLNYPSKKNALIYFDPPYRPLSKSSSFTKYSRQDFNDKDQIKLAELFRLLNSKGHKLILSNSDPTNTRKDDKFFDELYKDFKISRVLARRSINSNASKRGVLTEILVTN